MSTITAEGLTKRYGDVIAVDDLSFSLAPGAVTGFLGPNGAGKSTTMQMLLGLARPTAGTATIDGVAYQHLQQPFRHVGALLETTGFHPGRSALDHLRVLAALADVPGERVGQVLDQVDLTSAARRRVGGFSLGMRQRLGLAAALLGDPSILVLDEPMNGLDPEGIRWLRGLFGELAAEGRTLLVSSHVLSELASVIDHVLIISRGRLITHEPVARNADLEAMFLAKTRKDPHVNPTAITAAR